MERRRCLAHLRCDGFVLRVEARAERFVREGRVTLEKIVILKEIYAHPACMRPGDDWLKEAQNTRARALRRRILKRIEEVKLQKKVAHRASPPRPLKHAVYRRAEGYCEYPGCRCRTGLQLAHVHPHAAGGPWHMQNVVLLCPAHHTMFHIKPCSTRDDWCSSGTVRTTGARASRSAI